MYCVFYRLQTTEQLGKYLRLPAQLVSQYYVQPTYRRGAGLSPFPQGPRCMIVRTHLNGVGTEQILMTEKLASVMLQIERLFLVHSTVFVGSI